ncbi:TPA: HNH endonuclease [Escherichia coli]|nr:hypothetical protein [Salmonella enterica subsp. enterica]HCS4643472.1 HNH endonuclease [Escherichia coli]HCS4780506.1 HNH endonuclease [Escherichia coli]HCS4966721.1 HNH endonuclease [Escherichia coli]HCS5247169.1 HNH endonuclease [Escherichia coli]
MARSADYHGYTVFDDGTIPLSKRDHTTMFCFDNGRGYLCVTMLIEGKQCTKGVHHLVAECFVSNPDPERLTWVNHKDGNKYNNAYWNLEWTTPGGNIKHAYDNDLRVRPVGEYNANAVLTEDEVMEICELLQSGLRQCEIRDLGYPYETVRAIKQRRQWKHISKNYTW